MKTPMFSYVFMKILEMSPRSYDRRIDKISRGRVRAAKEAVAALIPGGSRVLDIGCGTGELASMLVARGATVDGFDLSPSMVEAAKGRIEAENLLGNCTVRQMGVDNMDDLPYAAYDAVVSTLTFSELSQDERRFALTHGFRTLRPGGLLVIADEVRPRGRARRMLHAITRAPMAALTYLVSRASTRPLRDLAGEVTAAGFDIDREVRSQGDAFVILVAHRPGGGEVT